MSKTSGSHAHHGERTGSGPVAGAPVVAAGGPGPYASRVRPNTVGKPMATPSGAVKIPVYKEGS